MIRYNQLIATITGRQRLHHEWLNARWHVQPGRHLAGLQVSRQAAKERSKLEIHQLLAQMLGVHMGNIHGFPIEHNRGVTPNRGHLAAEVGAFLAGNQLFSPGRFNISNMLVNTVQRTVLQQQGHGRLLPHPWHTGDVIAGITLQRLEVQKLASGHTQLGFERRWVVLLNMGQATLKRIHFGKGAYQLEHIKITGDKAGFDTSGLGLGCKRTHNIIGFVIIGFKERPAQGL